MHQTLERIYVISKNLSNSHKFVMCIKILLYGSYYNACTHCIYSLPQQIFTDVLVPPQVRNMAASQCLYPFAHPSSLNSDRTERKVMQKEGSRNAAIELSG